MTLLLFAQPQVNQKPGDVSQPLITEPSRSLANVHGMPCHGISLLLLHFWFPQSPKDLSLQALLRVTFNIHAPVTLSSFRTLQSLLFTYLLTCLLTIVLSISYVR